MNEGGRSQTKGTATECSCRREWWSTEVFSALADTHHGLQASPTAAASCGRELLLPRHPLHARHTMTREQACPGAVLHEAGSSRPQERQQLAAVVTTRCACTGGKFLVPVLQHSSTPRGFPTGCRTIRHSGPPFLAQFPKLGKQNAELFQALEKTWFPFSKAWKTRSGETALDSGGGVFYCAPQCAACRAVLWAKWAEWSQQNKTEIWAWKAFKSLV